MSAAIQHRIHKQPVLNSASLWPAYINDDLSSNTRLLGRAKRVGFSSYPDSISPQYKQYGANFNELNRSGTPFISKIRSFHLGTEDNEDRNEDNNNHNGLQQQLNQNNQLRSGQEELPINPETFDTTERYNQNCQVDNPANDENTKDAATLRAIYTTSTQRLYQGVDWSNKIVPAPSMTTKETRPDMISFRYEPEAKRYDPRSEKWQKLCSRPFSWDYVQTRDSRRVPRPVSFCSPSKNFGHIPGYMGHVSGEMDNPVSKVVSTNTPYTLQPKEWETARKGNIPGYTGCVFYSEYQPACINELDHRKSTSSTSYRRHNEVECNINSPFKKTSSMSRMVTLTHPFNPFNKVY